jgi:hypothetical protein
MKSIPSLVWIVPIIFLIVAGGLDAPYGYYTFTQIVTCCAAALIAFVGFRNRPVSQWCVPLVLAAVLFNPLIPIRLPPQIWPYFDFATAALFAAHLIFIRWAPYPVLIRQIFRGLAFVALAALVGSGALLLVLCGTRLILPRPWMALDVNVFSGLVGFALFVMFGGSILIHRLLKHPLRGTDEPAAPLRQVEIEQA